MEKILIYSLAVFYIIYMLYSIYLISKYYERHKKLEKYYPVHLKVTDKKILQYSIDGKEWNDIMAFYDKMKFLNKDGKISEGPGFVPLRIRDDQTADDWQGCLGSIQQVHEWEKKAFAHYKEAIYKYLEDNE